MNKSWNSSGQDLNQHVEARNKQGGIKAQVKLM